MSLDSPAHSQTPMISRDLPEAPEAEPRAEGALQRIRGNVAAAHDHIQTLQAETRRLAAERDAWMQELFEANRYNAYLVQVRQAVAESEANLRSRMEFLQQEVHRLEALCANVRPAYEPVDDARIVPLDNSRVVPLQEENAHLRRQIYELYASTSWRVSAPVRFIGRLLGRG